MLHGAGIFTDIWLKFMVNAAKYSSPMEHVGKQLFFLERLIQQIFHFMVLVPPSPWMESKIHKKKVVGKNNRMTNRKSFNPNRSQKHGIFPKNFTPKETDSESCQNLSQVLIETPPAAFTSMSCLGFSCNS